MDSQVIGFWREFVGLLILVEGNSLPGFCEVIFYIHAIFNIYYLIKKLIFNELELFFEIV